LLSYLQNLLGRALGGHLVENVWLLLRRLLLGVALIQAALKVYDALFQLFHAPTLPMYRLEKAVECLPDMVTHVSIPLCFTGRFNLLFHT